MPVWLASCGAATVAVEPWPSPAEPPAPARYPYAWAATARHDASPEHAESMLEQKLAAFARSVESRQRKWSVPPPIRLDSEALRDELEAIIDQVEDRADVAVHVRDLIGGHVVFDHMGEALLNPASNQKIVTSAAAIDLLGADYVFETHFGFADGKLYIRGEGDPTLDEDALGVAVRRVLRELDGATIEAVVVDDSAFSPDRLAPGFESGGAGVSYQAPSGALSLNFNTVEVVVYGVKGQRRPGVGVSPESTHVVVDNRARISSRDALSIRTRLVGEGASAKTVVEVSGSVKSGGRAKFERRRVGDPGLFAGGAVAQIIAVETKVPPPPVERGRFPDDLAATVVWASPPLLEVADRVLAFSNNFIAEQLLRTMGWRLSGEPGDWANGRAALEGYWTAIGNDAASIIFENGSGFSRGGRISPSALVDLIALAERNRREGADHSGLVDALPIAGEEGTLRARLRKSGKRVRAKTGTMDGVSGLSGVILSESGDPQVAFSILVNAHRNATLSAAKRRRVEDAIVMRLLDHLDDWELRWAVEILEAEAIVGAAP